MNSLTLTNRLLLFFLGSLAVVLAGFSGGIYAWAHFYLHQQADDRLESTLNMLIAAVEFM